MLFRALLFPLTLFLLPPQFPENTLHVDLRCVAGGYPATQELLGSRRLYDLVDRRCLRAVLESIVSLIWVSWGLAFAKIRQTTQGMGRGVYVAVPSSFQQHHQSHLTPWLLPCEQAVQDNPADWFVALK